MTMWQCSQPPLQPFIELSHDTLQRENIDRKDRPFFLGGGGVWGEEGRREGEGAGQFRNKIPARQ